jgi:hypothetical protein
MPFSASRAQVRKIEGRATECQRVGDEGNRVTPRICPDCGSTAYWTLSGFPDLIGIAVGNFADPSRPAPRVSAFEDRRHLWVSAPDSVERRRGNQGKRLEIDRRARRCAQVESNFLRSLHTRGQAGAYDFRRTAEARKQRETDPSYSPFVNYRFTISR